MWHEACDQHGVTANMRVACLYEMYGFLTQNANFDVYPSHHYYRGMPIVTYEALLQNKTTRIQLYQYADGNTYNSRSISTLCNESFFSDITR